MAGLDTRRLAVILAIILVVLGVLLTRLLSLQVFGSQEWIDLAVENFTRNISSPAPRGIIYDRNGYILARNVASYNITITPAALPDDDADIQTNLPGGLGSHRHSGEQRHGRRSQAFCRLRGGTGHCSTRGARRFTRALQPSASQVQRQRDGRPDDPGTRCGLARRRSGD